jgi:RNA polymerase sigma-70 factor (ECF subfamily)
MTMRDPVNETTIAAFRRGEAEAFGRITHRYRAELHVHCYRMTGSLDDAEDLVQETFVRAWEKRETYEGRAGIRAWLYRIATNLSIDAIRARAARAIADEGHRPTAYSRFPWLQPYPDAMLDLASDDPSPDTRVAMRDAIELAFLATVQLLPPKQRAVLMLRDVLDFSAAETAAILEESTAAVNSALQRARATLARHRGAQEEVSHPTAPTFDEAMLLQTFMEAQDRGDIDAIVELLRDDVRMTLLPDCETWDGREEVARELRRKRAGFNGDVRSIPIAANRRPAVAVYVREQNASTYQAWAIVLLGLQSGEVREIATFASPDLFARFNLPAILES